MSYCLDMGKSLHSRQDEAQVKILVIDKEEATIRVLTHLLERSGYQVISTQSAKDAFFLLRATPADLIITDLFMPTSTTSKSSRTSKIYRDTAVVAISGGNNMADRAPLELAPKKTPTVLFTNPSKPPSLSKPSPQHSLEHTSRQYLQ